MSAAVSETQSALTASRSATSWATNPEWAPCTRRKSANTIAALCRTGSVPRNLLRACSGVMPARPRRHSWTALVLGAAFVAGWATSNGRMKLNEEDGHSEAGLIHGITAGPRSGPHTKPAGSGMIGDHWNEDEEDQNDEAGGGAKDVLIDPADSRSDMGDEVDVDEGGGAAAAATDEPSASDVTGTDA